MSLHEHQIVFDYVIPPYAWHYKCVVEGCDYETDSLRAPDQSDEIARLRAEVERLQEEVTSNEEWSREIHEAMATATESRIRDLPMMIAKAERFRIERDEALAQVAVLMREYVKLLPDKEQLTYAHCPLLLPAWVQGKTRALLDRLHHAEEIARDVGEEHEKDALKLENLWQRLQRAEAENTELKKRLGVEA